MKARRSPIPSAGLEIKLSLTFRGPQELTNKMKALLRFNYSWDYTGEAPPQRTDPQRGSSAEDSSDEEIEFDPPADSEAEVQQA